MRILFLPSPVTHNFCYGIPEVIIYAVNSVQILQQILHFSLDCLDIIQPWLVFGSFVYFQCQRKVPVTYCFTAVC